MRDRAPARIVPLLYFGTAHASLALAGVLVAWSPRAVAGFFYHSWMLAIVHLVTLGWITCSILGAIDRIHRAIQRHNDQVRRQARSRGPSPASIYAASD